MEYSLIEGWKVKLDRISHQITSDRTLEVHHETIDRLGIYPRKLARY